VLRFGDGGARCHMDRTVRFEGAGCFAGRHTVARKLSPAFEDHEKDQRDQNDRRNRAVDREQIHTGNDRRFGASDSVQ